MAQLGACLAAYAQVSDSNVCVRVALQVLGVAGHVAPARAHPRCQGVAEGHIVPHDTRICYRGFSFQGGGIPGTVARSRGPLLRRRLTGVSTRLLLLSLRPWEAGDQGG